MKYQTWIVMLLLVVWAVPAQSITRTEAVSEAEAEANASMSSAPSGSLLLIGNFLHSNYACCNNPPACPPNSRYYEFTTCQAYPPLYLPDCTSYSWTGNPYNYGGNQFHATAQTNINSGYGIGANCSCYYNCNGGTESWAAGIDCSALLSFIIWGSDNNCAGLVSVSTQINWADLQPGDIIVSTSEGHSMMFKEWVSKPNDMIVIHANATAMRTSVNTKNQATLVSQGFLPYKPNPFNNTNTVVAFDGAWAFREADGTHVSWVTAPERGSRIFEIYGGEGGAGLLATIFAEGGEAPHYYETVVPDAETYRIVEVDDDPYQSHSTRPITLDRPRNVEQLRQMNTMLADWRGAAAVMPQHKKPQRPQGSPQTVTVTDYVFYSSRQDFLDATLSVRNHFSTKGRTSQTILGTGTAVDCKAQMQAIWQEAVNTGYPRLPFLVIVGSAYEDPADARNVVGTFYYPDADGNCYFGDCASDALIAEFNGDDIPDVPWTRIPGVNLVDIQNSVQAALYYYAGQNIRPEKVLILDGDLDDICAQQPEPWSTLQDVEAMYTADNIATIVRHESQYTSCSSYSEKLTDFQQILNTGVTEMIGTGQWTNRSSLPAWIVQKYYTPVFDITHVPYPQLFVAEFPGCELGGLDRLNPGQWPPIAHLFLTADPDQSATAVAWFGHMRGGLEYRHLSFARRFFQNRTGALASNATVHSVYFDTIRQLGNEDPEARSYLLLAAAYGWPVQLPDMIPPPPPPPPPPCRKCPKPVVVVSGAPPNVTTLSGNYPNPFNPSTTIRYGLAERASVSLVVYDVTGRRVKTLAVKEPHDAGWFEVDWDGFDDRGNLAASGIYFYRMTMTASHEVFTKKMLLLK